MDYVVNLILISEFELPKGALINRQFENMAWEQVYDILPDIPDCPFDCSNCPITEQATNIPAFPIKCRKFGSFDKHISQDEIEKAKNGSYSSEDLKEKGIPKDILEKDFSKLPDWHKKFQNAYQYAKTIGKLPAGMDRLVDIVEPSVDWRELLARYINQNIPYDFTYRRPSRKSIVSEHYFPSTLKEFIEVLGCIDTSGSMSDEEVKVGLGVFLNILHSFENVKITLFSCDSKLYVANEVSSEYDLKTAKIKGGGGTDFRPMFRWIKKNKPDTKGLVYFTDAFGTFPELDDVLPGMEVIWVISKEGDENRVPEYFTNIIKLKI